VRLRRTVVLSAAAAVVTACLSTTAAHADAHPPADPLCTDVSAPVHLNVGVFSRSPVVSVADYQGFLAAQNVSVTFVQVAGSTDQFTQLSSGATDLIMTASDNVANYRLNASNALHRTLPVQIVAATDGGYNLQLFATPGTPSVESLRGRTLGVDATNSGFAFLAYDILAQHGLTAPTKQADGSYLSPDYTISPIGGVFNRYTNITGSLGATRTVDATLLSNGFDILGADHGLVGFEDVRDVTNPYLSGVVAGLDPWLSAHRCETVRFVRALEAAARYATDPANAATVTADIAKDQPGFAGPDFAPKYYQVTVDPTIGQYRNLEIDPRGLYDVLALRKKYAGFDGPQSIALLSTPLGRLYTEQYALTAELGSLPPH
jgi:ABC-type nitrate/sulfonate/bicarbonate transport system substrate-binding protein